MSGHKKRRVGSSCAVSSVRLLRHPGTAKNANLSSWHRRFHGASPVTDAIATTILEDDDWHDQFLVESARVLGEHQELVTKGLDEAGIRYNKQA